MPTDTSDTAIRMRDVHTRFGTHVVHNGVDLEVRHAEVMALIGGSGSGKSTLLREMVLLQRPSSGSVEVLGVALEGIRLQEAQPLRMRWGMMFQHGGLFGSLTVLENVGLPLREHTQLPDTLVDEIAHWKLSLSGLRPDAATQYPSELSGGMRKRAALARALALDPELLFLDEPTAGLDPESAAGVDELVLQLRALFGLTIVVVTHDLDSLWRVADRVAVLGDGKVQAVDSMQALSTMDHPAVRPFFTGPRARAAQHSASAPAPYTPETEAEAEAPTHVPGEGPSKPK